MSLPPPPPPPPPRLRSLDQFRGYTVLGMFLVNYAGFFHALPAQLKHHHTFFSYSDSIMPQFLFAVGFAYRLTLLRRLRENGAAAAYGRVVRRILGLGLLAVIVHRLDGGVRSWEELCDIGPGGVLMLGFQRSPFQTLLHIAVTSLWVLPVIAAGVAARVGFMIVSAVLHVALSAWFYYGWVMWRPGIDGGPLGFLSWSVPLLVGSLAYDLVAAAPANRPPWGKLAAWGAAVMALGYGLSCLNTMTPPNTTPVGGAGWLVEPPFVPPARPVNLWTMSQRAGAISYTVFGAGFSLAVYALFVWANDVRGWHWGAFDTLGRNALAGYLLHDLVMDAMKPFTPRDAPLWFAASAEGVFLLITYVFLKSLENQKVFIRI
jgi:predicted acyltransferase